MMNMLRLQSRCLLLSVVFLIGGCVPVEDLGNYWARGTIDPQLTGDWQVLGARYRIEEDFLSFRPSGKEYRVWQTRADEPEHWPVGMRPTTEVRARTLRLKNHRFLMVMQSAAAPTLPGVPRYSGLQRYSLSGNQLTLYALDENALNLAIKQGTITGRAVKPLSSEEPSLSPEAVAAITTLDARTAATLARLADQPRLWKASRYRRIKDLGSALKRARAYPATDKTPANTEVIINLPDLRFFAGGKADALRRHLEASPEWLVTKDGQELVAFRRVREDGRWDGASGGYHSWFDRQGRFFQTRCMFRFESPPAGAFANEFNRSFLKVARPTAGRVRLNLRVDDQGIHSYLAVGEPGLWLEFLEQTPNENRVLTRQTLTWAAGFLKALRAAESDIRRLGYAPALMPPDATKLGQPSLEMSGSGSLYEMVIWANPGKESMVYLKAFDAQTGVQLTDEQISLGLREFMGWSDDPKRIFRCEGAVFAPRGATRQFQVRLELWLHPLNGGPDTKVLETAKPFTAPVEDLGLADEG